MKISEYYDLPDFDTNNLSEAKIKHYIDIIKQKYIAYWQHTIHHSKKLQFYSLFKHDYKISSYLDLIRNSLHCIIIVINCNFMLLKLLQYCNYIIIVMEIKLMLLLTPA